jgi:hypothetical protein
MSVSRERPQAFLEYSLPLSEIIRYTIIQTQKTSSKAITSDQAAGRISAEDAKIFIVDGHYKDDKRKLFLRPNRDNAHWCTDISLLNMCDIVIVTPRVVESGFFARW